MQDDATGLTYMQARYYDPVVGRFLAVDPVGFTASRLHSFNRYEYSRNSPMTYVDPTGETDVYFGGLRDSRRRIVGQYQAAHPSTESRTTAFFQHNQGKQAEKFIKANAQNGEPINVIGHSYGATTAAAVVDNLAKAGVQVHNLVGVDPVSKLGRFWVDGSSAKNIVAVFGSAAPGGGPDASNFIENVGKILGSLTLSGTMPSVFSEANQTIGLAVDHEDFKNLYEGANVPKKSAAQIVDDNYDDSCC